MSPEVVEILRIEALEVAPPGEDFTQSLMEKIANNASRAPVTSTAGPVNPTAAAAGAIRTAAPLLISNVSVLTIALIESGIRAWRHLRAQ